MPRTSRGAPSAVRLLLLVGVVMAVALSLANGRLIWGPHLAFEIVGMALFVAFVGLEVRRPWLTPRILAAAAAVLLAVAVAWAPAESADVWAHVMYGRILAVHHANPYESPPSAFPRDRWVRLVRPIWRDTPSLYGPAFLGAAAGVVRLADGSALRARLGFQSLAALSVAAIALLLWRATRDPLAVALVALNPLVMIGAVNGAHPDALLSLLVLAAVVLAGGRRVALAGGAAGLSMLVKPIAALPSAVLVLWVWRRLGGRAAAITAAVAAAVMAAGYLPFDPEAALRALGAEGGLTNRFSLWRLAWWVHPVVLADGERHIPNAAAWSLLAVLVALVLLAVVPLLHRPTPTHAVAAGLAVALLVSLYVEPWYVMWLLPVAALAWGQARTGGAPSGLAGAGGPVALALALPAALTVAYGIALHRGLGTFGDRLRTAGFDVLAAADAMGVVAILWWVRRQARATSGPEGVAAGSGDGLSGGSGPAPSARARAGSEPPHGSPAGRPPRPGGGDGSR